MLTTYVGAIRYAREADTLPFSRQAKQSRTPKPSDALSAFYRDRVFDSDSLQYASWEYVAILEKHQIIPSMSRPANPYDNAGCESFLKTLKQEEIYVHEYESLKQLRANIEQFIEQYYNRLRLHSALGYRPPEEFEQQAERRNQSADLNVAAVILRFGKSFPGDASRSGGNREPEIAQP